MSLPGRPWQGHGRLLCLFRSVASISFWISSMSSSRVRRVRFRRVCCIRNHQINVKSRTLHLQKSHQDLRCPRHYQDSNPKSGQFAKQCHLQTCHCPLDRSVENPGRIPGSFRASRRLQKLWRVSRLRSSSFEYVSSPTSVNLKLTRIWNILKYSMSEVY